jgi:hypothetical protein
MDASNPGILFTGPRHCSCLSAGYLKRHELETHTGTVQGLATVRFWYLKTWKYGTVRYMYIVYRTVRYGTVPYIICSLDLVKKKSFLERARFFFLAIYCTGIYVRWNKFNISNLSWPLRFAGCQADPYSRGKLWFFFMIFGNYRYYRVAEFAKESVETSSFETL